MWLTTKIFNIPIEDYAVSKGHPLPKFGSTSYVREVSKLIVDNIGDTEFGSAAFFRDITKAVVNNTHELLSVSTPKKFSGIEETVFVGLPVKVGSTIGTSPYDTLTKNEQATIGDEARAIYQTYLTAMDNIE